MLLCYTSATGNIGQELLDLSDFKVYKLWQNCYLYFSFSFLPPPFFFLALIVSLHSISFTFLSHFAFPLPFASPYPILTLESYCKMQLQTKGPEKLPYVYQHIFHPRVFIQWDTSIPKMHVCVQMSMHKRLCAHTVRENT